MYRRSRNRGDFKVPAKSSVESKSLPEKAEQPPHSDSTGLGLGSSQSQTSPVYVGTADISPKARDMDSDPAKVLNPSLSAAEESSSPAKERIDDSDDDVICLGKSWEQPSGPIDLCEAIAPRTDATVGFVKAKRVHMESQECLKHSETAEGSSPLTKPASVIKSSKDPNRGLYPRHKQKSVPLALNQYEPPKGFVKASNLGVALPSAVQKQIENERGNQDFASQNLPESGSGAVNSQFRSNFVVGQRGRKKKLPQQGNTLQKYFSASPQKSGFPESHYPDESSAKSSLSFSQGSCDDLPDIANVAHRSGPSVSHSSVTGAARTAKSSHSFSQGSCDDLPNIPGPSQSHSSAAGAAWTAKNSHSFSQGSCEDLPDLPGLSLSQNSAVRLAWTVTPPSLPNLDTDYNTVKTLQPSKLKAAGTKRKRSAAAGKSTDVRLIGPAAHNLRKASFLYDTELAKPVKRVKEGDKYGLLGSGKAPPEQTNTGSYIQGLPYELMVNIFCRLPIMDLLLNVNKVCTDWNDIISYEGFLPWKKRYFRVKKRLTEDLQMVSQLLGKHDMTSAENFLIQLIRYMKTFKKVTSPGMDTHLQKHHKYNTAKDIFTERLTDCLGSDQTPNPWCMITLLVILSEYVTDVQEIYLVLLGPSSETTAYEMVECLYCINTFLLTFKTMQQGAIWNGMHYRLYYALYLFENESTTTIDQLQNATSHGKGGQQSLHKYSTNTSVQMTHEQLRICNYNVTDGQIVKIIAFAGTGKTTTLVKYTRLRPNIKFLLVVYNKSVKEHAQTKFPANVTCKTGHGLAFGHEGRRFAAAKKLASSSLKVHNILKHYSSIKGESLYVQAKFVINTLERFMASADDFITTAHVPDHNVDDNGRRKQIDHSQKMHYAEEAEKYWKKMVNFEDQVMVTHDTYVKTYQLRKPRIYGYDIILIDEAQDMTPALADILLSQRNAKILVGDPHQQIYSFRGAVNAMQQVHATHTFYLTQSFRFGSEIAFVASSCLDLLKREKKTLVGNASTGSVRGDISGQMAIITRSNFTLFSQAVTKCCYGDYPGKVAFVGGAEAFGFEMILDIYALMCRFQPPSNGPAFNRTIKNTFIEGFSNIGELEKFATKTMDGEMLGKIKIVKAYNHALPSLISKIRSKCIKDIDLADLVLSTAHKSKGLEFQTVKLTDDYIVDLNDNIPGDVNKDESNLLYVAVTRAKKNLLMTPDLQSLLGKVGEQFLYPASSKELKASGTEFKCSGTDADFEPCAATIVKRAVNLPDRPEKKDVVFSPAMIAMDFIPLRLLYGPHPLPDESKENDYYNYEGGLIPVAFDIDEIDEAYELIYDPYGDELF